MRVDEPNPMLTVSVGDDCFHCGKKVEALPFVVWQGSDSEGTQIILHVECAQKLSDHLRADSQPRH